MQENISDGIGFEEYNRDSVEIIKTNNNFKFILKGNKKYDIWISDDYGPQMLKHVDNGNFTIEGKLDLNYGSQEDTFHDGIIMKFGSNTKILFGIVKEAHKYKKLAIYCPENANYKIYEETYLYEGNVYLKVKKIERDYIFYERRDNESDWKEKVIVTFDESIKKLASLPRLGSM